MVSRRSAVRAGLLRWLSWCVVPLGVRQHHVLLEPAESSLFQHHTALDRVTEL